MAETKTHDAPRVAQPTPMAAGDAPLLWGINAGPTGKDTLVIGLTPNWTRQVSLNSNAMHTHIDVAVVVGTDAADIQAKASALVPGITMLTEGGV